MRNLTLATALAAMASFPLAGAALAQSQAQPAQQQSVTHAATAGDLAALCDPAPGPLRLESIAYCQGYLTGAGQLHTALNPPNTGRRPLFCLPNPPPSVAESGIAFSAWIRANPQHAQSPAPEGLFRWAQATYPCPATPGRGRG
ncbi:Rap1a/Tai family immunity protein [Pseudoroseomonas globiformis]|uniref:Rap1a/Tai family immunity protein n=1 Tax=Teichococcus globiformis TaxID=2307229 RepID=A0ABV7G0R9_9PROT